MSEKVFYSFIEEDPATEAKSKDDFASYLRQGSASKSEDDKPDFSAATEGGFLITTSDDGDFHLIDAKRKIAELEAEVRGLRNKPFGKSFNPKPETDFEADKPYFVHDPEGDCFVFFATEEERDEHAEGIIQDHLDDCWDESVVNILAGVMTHKIKQVNLESRPDDVDEEGVASDGSYWDEDWQFKCDYKLVKAELC